MGIPSYFYQIVRNHGDRFMGSKKQVARLFLDLNCCIHGCKNRILKKYDTIPDDFENQIIQEVIQTILQFCKETSPRDLLWIAVDGVVPIAKMKQQRERRFNAVHTREIINQIHTSHNRPLQAQWDSNAITPGTEFMFKLCDTIRKNLGHIRKSCGVKLIEMNGVRNGGEGEQKIFEYMRNHINNDSNTEDVVYGLDADLIILSILQSQVQSASISLLREKQEFGKLLQGTDGRDELIRFRVSEFASVIPLQWGGPVHANRIKDYIVLMFLMGNDFVPHTPSLTFRSEGVERILDAYKSVNEAVVGDDDMICWKSLEKILKRLSEQEIYVLKQDEKVSLKIRSRILAGQIPFRHAVSSDPVEQEILALDWAHMRSNHALYPGTRKWQERYYTKMVGSRSVWSSTKCMVETIKKEYVRAIQWCWDYYRGEQVSDDWYYQYVSGPLLCDMTPLTPPPQSQKEEPPEGMIDARAQLVCVLPPSSHMCMSEEGRVIADECVDLYPTHYDSWEYGKRHAWECEAFLPRIPIKRITTMLERDAVDFDERRFPKRTDE